MTDAEQGLPVQPLIGTTLTDAMAVASDEAAAPVTAANDTPREPDAIDRILASLFGN